MCPATMLEYTDVNKAYYTGPASFSPIYVSTY